VTCGQCGTFNENERDNCVRCKKALHPAAMKGKIACSIHGNREATTSCNVCGIRLCASCAVNARGLDYCETCAPEDIARIDHEEDYERLPVLDPARAVRASFGLRLLGLLIEPAILIAALLILALVWFLWKGEIAFFLAPHSGAAFYFFYAVIISLWVIYSSIMVSMSGQTWGKQIAGVIVLAPDGRVLDLKRAAYRAGGALVSTLAFGVGFLQVLWDKDRRAWHDKFADTAVFLWEDIT